MDVVAIVALATSIISVFVTIWNVNRTHLLTKANHRSDIFAVCTNRYHDIVIRMPDELFDENVIELTPAILKHCMLYFDLCSEEHHLYYVKKEIDDEVWEKWKEGMIITVRSNKLYKTGWDNLYDFYNPEFRGFMDKYIFGYKRDINPANISKR